MHQAFEYFLRVLSILQSYNYFKLRTDREDKV